VAEAGELDMILDATCGARSMWFQKNDKETVYLDKRKGVFEYETSPNSKLPQRIFRARIFPTIKGDNRMLPFKNEVFDMILFDPPHQIGHKTGIYYTLYDELNPLSWTTDMIKTSKELFRVLKKGGFLILKWAELQKDLKTVLSFFPIQPLFGTNTSYKNRTWWIVFRKG